MFMKKRRYAQLMAELHDPNMTEAPPTPPQSESSDTNSDMESDVDLDSATSKHSCENEKPAKYPRTSINSVDDSDSVLAKVKGTKNINQNATEFYYRTNIWVGKKLNIYLFAAAGRVS